MTKVFVLGANGLIGQTVAFALKRRGYSVSGLIRDESQSLDLLKSEITPIIGTIENISSIRHAIEESSVIIDAISLSIGNTDPTEPNRQVLKLIAELSNKYSQKKRYIYTSGILVYGDNPDVVDETVPPKQKLIQARIQFEQEVVTNQDVEGVVIRPPYVYGGKGGATASFLYHNNGRPLVVGNPDRLSPWLHVDDLADAYVRVVEAPGSVVKGQIYNIGGEILTEKAVFVAAARAAGAKGEVEYRAPNDSFWEQFRIVTVKLSDKKIRTQLGWEPKITSFVENIDKYYKSYQAHKKQ